MDLDGVYLLQRMYERYVINLSKNRGKSMDSDDISAIFSGVGTCPSGLAKTKMPCWRQLLVT